MAPLHQYDAPLRRVLPEAEGDDVRSQGREGERRHESDSHADRDHGLHFLVAARLEADDGFEAGGSASIPENGQHLGRGAGRAAS